MVSPRRLISLVQLSCCIVLLCLLVSCGNKRGDAFYKTEIEKTEQVYATGQRVAAERYLDSIYQLDPGSTPWFRMKRYSLLSQWYYRKNKFFHSASLLDSQIAVIERYKLGQTYSHDYSVALSERGYAYLRDNDLEQSFDFFSRSRLANIAGDSCSYVGSTYALGMVTYRQKRYADAAHYFLEAERLVRQCQWTIFTFVKRQELLLNIGLSYSHLDSYDSATRYYAKALSYADSAVIFFPHDSDALHLKILANGVIRGNLADIFITQHQTDTAIQLLKESIAINNQKGRDVNDAMFSRIKLAELYQSTGRFPEMLTELTLLQHTLDSLPNNGIRSRSLHLQYLYYKQQGNQLAGEYFDRYQKLKDSLEAVENKLGKTDYAVQLREKDTQYRIALLTRDNQVNRLYLGIAVLLSVLTTVIIVLVSGGYRRSRKNVAALTALNHQVNQQKHDLETTMVQLREASHAKDRLMHVVAHDLRAPVGGIITLGAMIKEEPLSESQSEMMDMLINASGNAITLISEILEHGDTSMRPLITERIEANKFVSQVVALLQLRAAEKDQHIILQTAPASLYMLAHKEKMSRVLSNLLTNAIKFSPRGAAIDVSVSGHDGKVIIEVTDHGIGIPVKALPHIFEMFTSSKRYGTDGEVSFGLGLSICQQIVAVHNGKISVQSTEGEGSSFVIELPAVA